MPKSHYREPSFFDNLNLNMLSKIFPFYWRVLRTRPVDALGCGFLTGCSILVYLFGTLEVLPVLIGDASLPFKVVTLFACSYLLFGVLANIALIHYRNSSIANKVMPQPIIKPPPVSLCNGEETDATLKERTKYMGQHFLAKPFGEEGWHICAACEVFVPPRAWHCNQCRTCILRRDHHCVMVMACIGEENHCNFIGLLFYLAIGCTISTTLNFYYQTYYQDQVWWMFFVKCLVPFYSFIFNFDVRNILSGIALMGQFVSWFVLLYYLNLACKAKTVAENSRGISRAENGNKKFSIRNMKRFLGPNPFYRIVWPFHTVILKSIQAPFEQDNSDTRKGV